MKRILFITQAVDAQDHILGFVCRWLSALADRVERITVVCLREGHHGLPGNVTVLSLGKERRLSRVRYLANFYRHIWRTRNAYDTVFVHMNQLYVLLGWPLWRLMSKRIILWRNHPQGSLVTTIAGMLADRVLYTSPQSYTARFKNASQMPVGIDTSFFCRHPSTTSEPGTVLCLGRVSPVKRIELLLEAAAKLESDGVSLRVHIVGNAETRDLGYADELRQQASESVTFSPGVSVDTTPALYNTVWVAVNTTPSGSMDKTILEAMACETPVLVSNRALAGVIDDQCIFAEGDVVDLAQKLGAILRMNEEAHRALGLRLRSYVIKGHSLVRLMDSLAPLL